MCVTLFFAFIIPKLISFVFLAQTFIKLIKVVEINIFVHWQPNFLVTKEEDR